MNEYGLRLQYIQQSIQAFAKVMPVLARAAAAMGGDRHDRIHRQSQEAVVEI